MTPASSSHASDFAGPDGQVPMSAPARRLRTLREALRHTRLFRPSWHAGLSPVPPSPAPGAPPPPNQSSAADSTNS